MFAKKTKAAQGEFWVAAHQLPASPKSTFYARLDETLEYFEFAENVRALCAPAYKATNAGRPGIDPVVYLKMIMVGFFEDLPSERAIAEFSGTDNSRGQTVYLRSLRWRQEAMQTRVKCQKALWKQSDWGSWREREPRNRSSDTRFHGELFTHNQVQGYPNV